jgi:hypothetical protein
LGAIAEGGLSDVHQTLLAADDHAAALEVALTSSEPPLTSLMMIVRGILEATLQACELIDPDAIPIQQVARAAAFRLDAIEGNERTARAFPVSVLGDSTNRTEAVDGIHEWLDKSGGGRRKAQGDGSTQFVRGDRHSDAVCGCTVLA